MSDLPDGQLLFKLSEAAERLGVESYVLRYWAQEFDAYVKPLRVGQRRRLYSQEDLETFSVIKHLLHEKRFTLEGAKKQLDGALEGGSAGGAPAARKLLDFIEPAQGALSGGAAQGGGAPDAAAGGRGKSARSGSGRKKGKAQAGGGGPKDASGAERGAPLFGGADPPEGALRLVLAEVRSGLLDLKELILKPPREPEAPRADESGAKARPADD
jgi:DNA-binding transcriptional MerR regulator